MQHPHPHLAAAARDSGGRFAALRARGIEALPGCAVALPGMAAFGLFSVWAFSQGGYPRLVWYPGALFVLALLGAVALADRRAGAGVPRRVVWTLSAFAAFTVWSFLSVAWADTRADAWDGANRTLLYLLVFALFALVPWGTRAATVLTAAFPVAAGAAALHTVQGAVTAADPGRLFIEGRLAAPTGYPNATTALLLLAAFPAFHLASRRATPWYLRGGFLALAGVLLEVGLLPQSRGFLIAGPLAAVLYVAVVPGRLRTAVFAVPLASVTVHWLSPLLDVYVHASSGERLHPALVDARMALVASALVLVVAGTALALVDDRIELGAARAGRVDRVFSLALAAGAVVALVSALVVIGNPIGRVEQAWADFRSNADAASTSHFTSGFGSARYDVWRVALREIRSQPILGVGSDNYAVDYLRLRRTNLEPMYPHSVVLRAFSQTGVVGGALFLAFAGLAAASLWRVRSRGDPRGAALAAVALVVFGYWLIHGSLDWFWEFPALTAPVIALVAMWSRVGEGGLVAGRVARPWRASGLVVVALVAAASLALPYVSAAEVERAADGWRGNPAGAFAQLHRAADLNFLSSEPDLVAGAIASRIGDLPRMERAFAAATARDPDNWYAHLELGLVRARLGDRPGAVESLATARRLDPREPLIAYAMRRVHRGLPVSFRTIDARLLARLERRSG